MRMHPYTITDRATGERTKLIAPNRDAAMKAYVKRRLIVTRDAVARDAASADGEATPPDGKPFEVPGERTDGSVG